MIQTIGGYEFSDLEMITIERNSWRELFQSLEDYTNSDRLVGAQTVKLDGVFYARVHMVKLELFENEA